MRRVVRACVENRRERDCHWQCLQPFISGSVPLPAARAEDAVHISMGPPACTNIISRGVQGRKTVLTTSAVIRLRIRLSSYAMRTMIMLTTPISASLMTCAGSRFPGWPAVESGVDVAGTDNAEMPCRWGLVLCAALSVDISLVNPPHAPCGDGDGMTASVASSAMSARSDGELVSLRLLVGTMAALALGSSPGACVECIGSRFREGASG
jgi:hypothetical protein